MSDEGFSPDFQNPCHYVIIFKVSYVFKPCSDLQRCLQFNLRATAAIELHLPVTQN